MKSFVSLGLLAIAAASMAQEAARRDTLTGDVRFHEGFRSAFLENERTLRVYVPPQYLSEPNRRFPVLYMHDGQNLFSGLTSFIPNQEWRADESAEMLIRAGIIEPIIIVGIDNAGMSRGDEYLPLIIQNKDTLYGGRAEDYGRFLVDEVMPFIKDRYRVNTDPRKTGLCGSSFGGVITHYLGLTYPKVFGNLGIVSPSLWVGKHERMIDDLHTMANAIKRQRVWVDMGGDEADAKTRSTFETYTETWTKMLSKGGGICNAVMDEFAPHNEVAWARRFPSMLQFWYGVKR
ncbi:MAG: alpha/beta hydrolase [Chthonomonas sp.]|nr:alpha/beta hydrolase [Chthonomonas sp.]